MPTRKKKAPAKSAKPVKQGNPWEQFPDLGHLTGETKVMMEYRRRHRAVRYGCFRLQTAIAAGRDPIADLKDVLGKDADSFANYWLNGVAKYALIPGPDGNLQKTDVPTNKAGKKVEDMGGYLTFAELWDIDPNLNVYLRHSSIWQEWNATLMRVVPILGEH